MYNEKPTISKWVADIYDQKVTDIDDVEFLLSVIGQQPQKILEVCCGSGRILVPLAKAGHKVYGFDADECMLAKLPAKAKGLANIEWHKADAVHDDWGSEFDIVVLAGNILFNIVSDMDYEKTQEMFIQKASFALVQGGHIFIDYNPGGHNLTQSEQSHEEHSDWIVWEGTDNEGNFGKMTLLGDSYDANTGINRFTRRFELTLANGEKIQQDIPSHKHFATLNQIHSWLSLAGFVIEWEYENYKRNPINDKSCHAIIFAKKGVK